MEKTPKEEQNLVLRVIDFGMNKKTFYLVEMYKVLELSNEDETYLVDYLISWDGVINPNHIITSTFPIDKNRQKEYKENHIPCRVLPTAVFSYIDHLEIVEARKAAKEARILSWIAIGVSVILTTIQIIFGNK